MKKLKYIISILTALFCLVSTLDYTAKADVASALTNVDPVVMLTDYEITDGSLEIGGQFTIKATITNCNKYADAYNVVVDVSSEDMSLRLNDENTNQAYFEVVPAGKSITVEHTFSIEQNYPYESAMLTYTFYYSNAATLEFDNRTIITPLVTTPSKLDINVLSVATSATLGSRSLVNVRYTNTGTNDIEKVTMLIDGAIDENYKEIDLGSLKAGEQHMEDCYITFEKSGKQKINISFICEDDAGNKYTIEPKEYTVNVKSSSTASATIKKPNQKLKTAWQIFEIVFILLIALMLLLRIRSQKNKY